MLLIVVFFKECPKLFFATGSKMFKVLKDVAKFSEYAFHTLIDFILQLLCPPFPRKKKQETISIVPF